MRAVSRGRHFRRSAKCEEGEDLRVRPGLCVRLDAGKSLLRNRGFGRFGARRLQRVHLCLRADRSWVGVPFSCPCAIDAPSTQARARPTP